MRNQLITLVLWIVGSCAWIVTAPTIEIGDRVLEFADGDVAALGDVAIGKHETRFVVHNRSRRPAVIKSVTASCTCMELQFPTGPLNPGETRECVVTINVESGRKKNLAVVFDVEEPIAQRAVKMITYSGFQQDELRITAEPKSLAMSSGDVREVVFDCVWKSRAVIESQEPIVLLLQNARGVVLLKEEDVLRSERQLHRRFTVQLDARRHDRVVADVIVLAGQPVRAEHRGPLDIEISPSLVMKPASLSVGGAELKSGVDVGVVSVQLAEGWKLSDIEAPEWLAVREEGEALRVLLAKEPPFERGVGEIEVSATSASGTRVIRNLTCIFDRSQP